MKNEYEAYLINRICDIKGTPRETSISSQYQDEPIIIDLTAVPNVRMLFKGEDAGNPHALYRLHKATTKEICEGVDPSIGVR